jgi:predicted negative regulator of RcsB-dependent stress response
MKREPQKNIEEMFAPEGVRPVAEIEVGPTKHEQFLDRNYKKVILGVLACGLIFGGYVIYDGLKTDKVNQAGASLISAFQPDGTLNLSQLQKVQTDFRGTNAAETSAYLQGLALWGQGNEDEGNKQMEAFIQNTSDSALKSQASAILGCHYMRAGKNDDAKRCFKFTVDSADQLYSPLALISLGDMARSAGNADEAKTYYAELLQKYPDSVYANSEWGVPLREDLLGVQAPSLVSPDQK